MRRNHIITAAVAVVLIAVGVVGGFKIHDAFFTLPGSYQGTMYIIEIFLIGKY